VGAGDEVTTGQIPFTPRAKKVLELSLREGLSLGHNYIGTEHILLGLVRVNEGVAARILLDFDVDAERIRVELIRMLSGEGRVGARAASVPPRRAVASMPRRTTESASLSSWMVPLLLGWALCALALGVGVLIGWLIWG
jgi:ATP-dependent Clp protease ATP-binding subunit ClpA